MRWLLDYTAQQSYGIAFHGCHARGRRPAYAAQARSFRLPLPEPVQGVACHTTNLWADPGAGFLQRHPSLHRPPQGIAGPTARRRAPGAAAGCAVPPAAVQPHAGPRRGRAHMGPPGGGDRRDRRRPRTACRPCHARHPGRLRPQHREHDRHREGPGRPRWATAGQRAVCVWRLPGPACHHGGRAGRILRPRLPCRDLGWRRRGRAHQRGDAALPGVRVRVDLRGRDVRDLVRGRLRGPEGCRRGHHPPRQADRGRAADGGGQRFPAVPVHDRRRRRAEHGDHRDGGAVPPRRRPCAGAAPPLVRGGQLVR